MKCLPLALCILLGACATQPVVVLDSGHNPKGSKLGAGAISVTGKDEVAYNDVFVRELATALQRAGYAIKFTRLSHQSASLDLRADIANAQKHALLISIHHDSTQLINLKPIQTGGVDTYQTTRPIIGSSLHVSRLGGDYAGSLALATDIGQAWQSIGRTPNLDHANPTYPTPLPLADAALGIYHHDDLRILKNAKLPAVLLEIGVIVDKGDEQFVQNPKERAKLINAIVSGVDAFVGR